MEDVHINYGDNLSNIVPGRMLHTNLYVTLGIFILRGKGYYGDR